MVPISPNIYSAEAVVFDNKGLFDLQQKIADRRAKKQAAEQEALDTYLKETSKIPESYGMRNIDKKEFAKKVDDFRLLSNEFRKSPKNLEKRLQLEQAADRLKLFVSRSKEAKEGTKSFNNFIVDISTNPEKRKSVDIQRLMLDKEIHDLPLDFNAPYLGIVREDKEFNPNYYIPKPFDFQKTFDESAKGPGIEISELSVGPSKTKGYDEIKKGFGESAIKSIASNFAKDVEADSEKESYYKVRFNNLTPEKLAEQNIRLKKYFPKMEVDDDNPVSLAMAEAIEEAERRAFTDLRAISRGSTFNFGGGGGVGGAGKIDLTTYRDVGESKDVTDIFQGVKVTGLPKGESMLAKQVLYNKKNNEITLTEWVGRDADGNPTGQQTRTIPYNVFLQNIKTLNPQADFKYIETLPYAKTGKAPSKLTMKESEYRNLPVSKRQEFLSKGGVVVK
jgi:uncharacterized protein YeeX (DUF496 family)